MELKSEFATPPTFLFNCFNRTFMELKLVLVEMLVRLKTSFNRTFMELK